MRTLAALLLVTTARLAEAQTDAGVATASSVLQLDYAPDPNFQRPKPASPVSLTIDLDFDWAGCADCAAPELGLFELRYSGICPTQYGYPLARLKLATGQKALAIELRDLDARERDQLAQASSPPRLGVCRASDSRISEFSCFQTAATYDKPRRRLRLKVTPTKAILSAPPHPPPSCPSDMVPSPRRAR